MEDFVVRAKNKAGKTFDGKGISDVKKKAVTNKNEPAEKFRKRL